MTMPVTWSRESLAWAAGLFEGEGSIITARNQFTVRMGMTDKDVVDRMHQTIGLGTIRGPYINTSGHNKKPMYFWCVNSSPQSYAVLVAMWPWLGERRRQRAAEAIRMFHTTKVHSKNKTECDAGHPLSGDNLYEHGGRRHCRACRRDAVQRLRLRRAAS